MPSREERGERVNGKQLKDRMRQRLLERREEKMKKRNVKLKEYRDTERMQQSYKAMLPVSRR